jgi:hypothetical protein
MLRLEFASAGAKAPALPSAGEVGTNGWPDNDGVLVAYGGLLDDDRGWMVLPRVGVYLFDAEVVVAFPEDGASDSLVCDGYRRTVLPMALQALGREVLHASAVRRRDGILALCAVSGTGKSTLAYGLSRRGYPLWADDALLLDSRHDAVMTLPLPFTVRLLPSAAAYFGAEGGVFHHPEREAPLAAVCVLERTDDGGDVAVERLAAAEAFPAVLTHAYCFTLDDEARKRRMMTAYMDLVARVPVYRVRLRGGLERLPTVIDGVDRAVAA